jgi:hypothetical protein
MSDDDNATKTELIILFAIPDLPVPLANHSNSTSIDAIEPKAFLEYGAYNLAKAQYGIVG